jgi:uncharacterized protein (UPF0332 family)
MVRPGTPQQHIAKAADLLEGARVLLAAGLPERAVPEAYYATLHLAQALLATAGLGAETHAGVHSLLARHFVKDGPLPSDAAQRFGHLMTDRLLADYGVDRQLDQVAAARSLRAASGLASEMIAALRSAAPHEAATLDALAAAARALSPE